MLIGELPSTYYNCLHFLSRYVESNICSASAYRQYNVALPKWLQNRPREFVMHCQHCLSEASKTGKEDVTMEGDSHFTIESQTNNSCFYSLQFGQGNTMPSCSCPDWQKHHWPCKHFLAVFGHFPEWGWEAMSSSYNSSPYFQVDQDVMNVSFNSDTFTSEMDPSEASGAQNHNPLFREQWECNTKEEEGESHISVAETSAVSTDTSTIHGQGSDFKEMLQRATERNPRPYLSLFR